MAGSNIKFFWRCEGTTLDATDDKTAGDSTAVLNSTAAINTDAAKIGTNGLDCPTVGDNAQFVISSGDLISGSAGSMGLWFRMTDWEFMRLIHAENSLSTGLRTRIYLTTDGADTSTGREVGFNIRLDGGSNVTLTTTAADLALNTWYFVVARWNQSLNDRRLEVYDSTLSLITSVEDLATAYDAPTGLDRLFIGDSIGAGTGDIHIDNVFIADNYSEALQDKANITSFTEYDGAAASTPAFRMSLLGVGR